MKKIVLPFLLCLASISCAQTNAPKITAKELNHDFGTIVAGQVVTHKFEIQNNGNGILTINQVHASCGCTAAEPEKKELKPGEKTVIRVEFDSANRLGPQEKTVYVMSNDPVNSELKLTFNCVIVERKNETAQNVKNADKKAENQKDIKTPKLKLSKYKYDFGEIQEGQLAKATIKFKNIGQGVLTISEVKSSCSCASTLLSSKTIKPGASGSIKIELDTSGRLGSFTRTVTIYSDDPTDPNQVITLTTKIQPRK